ncbi:MAG: hypothetical protein P1V97_11890, partial [Planctomycetota bacterium]|nr:hypothetical protein [Planctomycetota bacterium]
MRELKVQLLLDRDQVQYDLLCKHRLVSLDVLNAAMAHPNRSQFLDLCEYLVHGRVLSPRGAADTRAEALIVMHERGAHLNVAVAGTPTLNDIERGLAR